MIQATHPIVTHAPDYLEYTLQALAIFVGFLAIYLTSRRARKEDRRASKEARKADRKTLLGIIQGQTAISTKVDRAIGDIERLQITVNKIPSHYISKMDCKDLRETLK